MTTRHTDHITARPDGLHIPYLKLHGHNTDHSPAATLRTNEPSGRLMARRHPYQSESFMVAITYGGRNVWINPTHLAHRHCEACLGIWETHAGHAAEIVAHEGDNSMYCLTMLPTLSGNDTVLLHANELPDRWFVDEEAQ